MGFMPHDGNPLKALSYAQARARGGTAGLHNFTDPWRVRNTASENVFAYIDAKTADVLVGRTGTVHPYLKEIADGRAEFGLVHIPNYIGRSPAALGVGETTYSVSLPEGFSSVTLVPSGAACADGAVVTQQQSQHIGAAPMTFTGLSGVIDLTVRSEHDICYVVLERLYATKGAARP